MDDSAYSPMQYEVLTKRFKDYGPTYTLCLKIFLTRQEYKKILEFVIEETKREREFNYCGWGNFLPFCICYYFGPVDFTKDWCCGLISGKYFCSEFILSALFEANRIEQTIGNYSPHNVSVNRLYEILYNNGMGIGVVSAINSKIEEKDKITERNMHNEIEQEIERARSSFY